MKVFILIKKKPQEIVGVYENKQDAYEVMKDNLNNYFINEQEVIHSDFKAKSMIDINKKVYDPKHFNDIMPFGKYKGKTIGDIIQENPGYLLWCCDYLDFEVDEECLELINAAKEKQS